MDIHMTYTRSVPAWLFFTFSHTMTENGKK
jgi:hypothetical protein